MKTIDYIPRVSGNKEIPKGIKELYQKTREIASTFQIKLSEGKCNEKLPS